MDKRIYIKDWLAIKPYERQTITDGYYLRICNEVKRAIATSEYLIVFQKYLSNKDIDLLSCFLTSYFEDGLQYFTAIENEQELIVTRNLKDFKGSKLPTMTAKQFIETI